MQTIFLLYFLAQEVIIVITLRLHHKLDKSTIDIYSSTATKLSQSHGILQPKTRPIVPVVVVVVVGDIKYSALTSHLSE